MCFPNGKQDYIIVHCHNIHRKGHFLGLLFLLSVFIVFLMYIVLLQMFIVLVFIMLLVLLLLPQICIMLIVFIIFIIFHREKGLFENDLSDRHFQLWKVWIEHIRVGLWQKCMVLNGEFLFLGVVGSYILPQHLNHVNGSTNYSRLSGQILLNPSLFINCSQVFRFILMLLENTLFCWEVVMALTLGPF